MKFFAKRKIEYLLKSACLCIGIVLLLAGCADLYTPPTEDLEAVAPLEVTFFDVGQGDCALISLPDEKYVLIDGGNVPDGELIATELQKMGISELEIMVATHPHEDHIGGLDDVLAALKVNQIYMPEISEKDTPTTKTYEYFLDAAINEGCDVYPAKAGETILKGEDYSLLCLSPSRSDIGDINNYSVVLKLSYKEADFLFTGDAEKEIEEEILSSGYDISAEIIKAGHHGSRTSCSKKFLEAVNPIYAVISCGPNNSYGHPHKETIKALAEQGTKIYRTDELGTITIGTDGENIYFSNNNSLILDGNKR